MSLREVRLRQALFAMVLGGALAVTGCATTGTNATGEAEAREEQASRAEAPEAAKVSVEYINVVGNGDRVLVGTTGPVRYTVFKLTDPSRLIIDMPGIDLSKVGSPISVGNDFLGEISAVTYGGDSDIGRIVITLGDDVDHEVKTGEKSILVSLVKAPAAAAEGAVARASIDTVVEEPLAVKPSPVTAAETTAPAAKPAPKPAPARTEPARAATRALNVESSKDGSSTVIRIATDGRAASYNAFVLSSPARVVVDLFGVSNSTGKDAVGLKDEFVKGVRIGSYPDKARFVFDASGRNLPPHAVTVEDGALVLTMGPGVKPAAAEKPAAKAPALKTEAPRVQVASTAPVEAPKAQVTAAAPAPAESPKAPAQAPVEPAAAPAKTEAPVKTEAPAPAKTEAPAKAQVEGAKVENIDYRKVGDKGRLMITSSAKPEYRIKEGRDGKTLVLDIKDASIPDSLTRTLDASKLDTSVASISSYQESLSPRTVRVLVKLKDKAAYNVQELDRSLAIDFAQAAAAPAPAADAQGKAPSDKIVVAQGAEYNGKRIDLDMMDANVSDVLRLLAEISNLNIVASDDVKGTISLRLKNVPWDQAFDLILKSKGLDSLKEGNVIRVAPALKIRQERESALASRKAEEKLEDLEIEFVPVNYATAEDLTRQVKSVLSDRGDVTTDKRTNMLIIKDIRSGIDSARNVVKKLDTPIPQVLIEARIVEASSSFARDLGIQWGADYQSAGNTSATLMGATTTSGQSFTAPTTTPAFTDRTGAQNFAVNLPATGNAGSLGALGFMLGKAGSSPLVLDLRLSAGESQGQVKTISRPRITTLDNKEAKIEQGESIPFETTSAAGTATTFVDANLSLTVTPHITPDGSVLMKIKASRNSIGTFTTSDGKPSINKKESTTEVLVKDGETTVIGGIVITDKNNQEKGIPYLKDIPVLGWLFKNKSVTDSQQELLIFITPKIIKDKTVG